MSELVIVFVHGYSVTNFGTYGGLPQRLLNEANVRGYKVRTEDVFLGRYISFNDQVRLSDVASALEFAINQQLKKETAFVCITHSTGGPLVRTWWHEFYQKKSLKCPMSHLIMLAPANHGSALAQLGKSRLSRIRSWFDSTEPGQGILDWLELGSPDAWQLNKDWIFNGNEAKKKTGVFPFVITGEDIDRKMYDHINSYTGETGSDGAVRVASANMNSRYLRLQQSEPKITENKLSAQELLITEYKEADPTPLSIIKGKSHSGNEMGIMRSVKAEISDRASSELIDKIFACIKVKTEKDYKAAFIKFTDDTFKVQQESKIELEINPARNKIYIHDRYSMLIFHVQDREGNIVHDFDLILTGENNDPDLLPTGFFGDRQCNHVNQNTITYYVNFDVLTGTGEIRDLNGEVVRKSIRGLSELGLTVAARPVEGFIRYLPCNIRASKELLYKVIQPNSTTLIDIYLHRLVSDEVFRFEDHHSEAAVLDFKRQQPGSNIIS